MATYMTPNMYSSGLYDGGMGMDHVSQQYTTQPPRSPSPSPGVLPPVLPAPGGRPVSPVIHPGQLDQRLYQDQQLQLDPRRQDPTYQDPRYEDPRYQDPRYQDPRLQQNIHHLPRVAPPTGRPVSPIPHVHQMAPPAQQYAPRLLHQPTFTQQQLQQQQLQQQQLQQQQLQQQQLQRQQLQQQQLQQQQLKQQQSQQFQQQQLMLQQAQQQQQQLMMQQHTHLHEDPLTQAQIPQNTRKSGVVPSMYVSPFPGLDPRLLQADAGIQPVVPPQQDNIQQPQPGTIQPTQDTTDANPVPEPDNALSGGATVNSITQQMFESTLDGKKSSTVKSTSPGQVTPPQTSEYAEEHGGDYKTVNVHEALAKYVHYEHVVHVMIYSDQERIIQHKGSAVSFRQPADIFMEVQQDGHIGFPGGPILTSDTSMVDAMNRQLKTRLNIKPKFLVRETDHVYTAANHTQLRVFHFFTMKVTEGEFAQLYRRGTQQGKSGWGNEFVGLLQVPLYTREDGVSGLPTFLTNMFSANSRNQLLHGIRHRQLLAPELLDQMVDKADQILKDWVDKSSKKT